MRKNLYIYKVIFNLLLFMFLFGACHKSTINQNAANAKKEDCSPVSDEEILKSHATAAIIHIDSSSEMKIMPNMIGKHNAITLWRNVLNDSRIIDGVKYYGKIGFIRWPGGTNNNAFNWKTGIVDAEYSGQSFAEHGRYYRQLVDRADIETKGFDRISHLREFVQRTGCMAMIVINVFEQTPEQVGDLAKYCRDNHIPVIYFELGNEVSFYVEESGNLPHRYNTGTDYLDRVKIFNDVIKNEYPGAKVIISMSNNQNRSFDEDVFKYSNPYWDAVTFHRFKGDGRSFEAAVKDSNTILDDYVSLIDDYYVANFQDPSTKIYMGEHGTFLSGILSNTYYAGIHEVETNLRLAAHPNISYLVSNALLGGMFRPGDKKDIEFSDSYQKGQSIDTEKLDFKLFSKVNVPALKVSDQAVNHSSAVWKTTVLGGATVSKADNSTMPALYAQAFKGDNGIDYIVMTNKSDRINHVTIKMDGIKVMQKMNITYTTASDPSITKSDLVSVSTVTVNNPVAVPPYSVMRIEWDGNRTPSKPEKPSLIYADVGNQQVDLKWTPVEDVLEYQVKIGTVPGHYTDTVEVRDTECYTVTGLINGKRYYFAVAASNKSGVSENSNEISAVIDVPDIPILRKVYAERESRVGVEWQSVPNAKGYILKYGTTSGNYTTSIDAGNNSGQMVTGLKNGQTYYFTVSAYNGMGLSNFSNEMSAVATDRLPLAPSSLRLKSEADSTAVLEWRPIFSETIHEFFEEDIAGNWTVDAGTWQVVPHPDTKRNIKMFKSASGENGRVLLTNGPTGDYEGEALIEILSGGSNGEVGVIARCVDKDNYYKFVYSLADKGFKLVKVQNGKTTILDTANVKGMGGNPLTMRMFIRIEGDQIECTLDSTSLLKAKDNAFTYGKFGLLADRQEAFYDMVRIYEPNTSGYNIYRSNNPYSGFECITSNVKETKYSDSGLDPDTVYYYKVSAFNQYGESYAFSNTVRKN